jgi:hypothetical protein
VLKNATLSTGEVASTTTSVTMAAMASSSHWTSLSQTLWPRNAHVGTTPPLRRNHHHQGVDPARGPKTRPTAPKPPDPGEAREETRVWAGGENRATPYRRQPRAPSAVGHRAGVGPPRPHTRSRPLGYGARNAGGMPQAPAPTRSPAQPAAPGRQRA